MNSLLDRFDQSPPPPLAVTSSTASSSTPTGSLAYSAPSTTITGSTSPTSTLGSASHSSNGLSNGAKAGIGIGASIAGLAILAGLVFLLFRRRKSNQLKRMSDRGSNSVGTGTPEMGGFYGKRGTVHSGGLGLQDAHGTNEYQVSSPSGGGEYGNTTAVSGPDIPPRSPGRAAKGVDNYF
jgi:hypothetical protein